MSGGVTRLHECILIKCRARTIPTRTGRPDARPSAGRSKVSARRKWGSTLFQLPTLTTELSPAVEITRMPADPHHAVHRAAAAQHPATHEQALRTLARGIRSVRNPPHYPGELARLHGQAGYVDIRVPVQAAGLQEKHPRAAVRAQAIGKNATGGSTPDDDVVPRLHLRHLVTLSLSLWTRSLMSASKYRQLYALLLGPSRSEYDQHSGLVCTGGFPLNNDTEAKIAITEVIYRDSSGARSHGQRSRRYRLASGRHGRLRPDLPRAGRRVARCMWANHAALAGHSHQVTNILIDVDGDSAGSEAYVTGFLWNVSDAGTVSHMVAIGRYLDRWSFRAGVWAIDHRRFVYDAVLPSDSSDRSLFGRLATQRSPRQSAARRDQTDPSYKVVGRLTPGLTV